MVLFYTKYFRTKSGEGPKLFGEVVYFGFRVRVTIGGRVSFFPVHLGLGFGLGTRLDPFFNSVLNAVFSK